MSAYSQDSLENEVIPISEARDAWECEDERSRANETAAAAEAAAALEEEESKNKRAKSAKNAIIADEEPAECAPSCRIRTENSEDIRGKKEVPTAAAAVAAVDAGSRHSSKLPAAAADKKLGSARRLVTAARTTPPPAPPPPPLPGLTGKNKRPASYLELYCRRFSAGRASICGGGGGVTKEPATSPKCPGEVADDDDDESELSFYRRLLISGRSAAGDHQRAATAEEYNDRLRRAFRRLRLGGEPKTLRLFSVQDYQNMKQPPRPARDRPQAVSPKMERLMRRSSYGNAVSELNRRRVPSSAGQKSKGVSKEEESSAAPRNHRPQTTTLSITQKRRASTTSASRLPVPRKPRTAPIGRPVTAAGRKHQPEPSLQALTERHSNERQIVDRIIRRTLLA